MVWLISFLIRFAVSQACYCTVTTWDATINATQFPIDAEIDAEIDDAMQFVDETQFADQTQCANETQLAEQTQFSVAQEDDGAAEESSQCLNAESPRANPSISTMLFSPLPEHTEWFSPKSRKQARDLAGPRVSIASSVLLPSSKAATKKPKRSAISRLRRRVISMLHCTSSFDVMHERPFSPSQMPQRYLKRESLQAFQTHNL